MKKRIFVWGTGRLAGKVIGRYIDIENIEGFIDNDKNKREYMGKKVFLPEVAANMNYDAVLVANLYCEEIYFQCQRLKMDLKKIIFLYNNYFLTDTNQDYNFVETILGKEYAEIVKKRYHVVRGVEAYGDLCLKNSDLIENGYFESDYVRIKSFELAVKEIRKRNIKGAVAEVGVFRGEFAQYINYAFPDRKCYLFDTFEGFNTEEAVKEMQDGNCTNAFIQAYKQTNIKNVLQKMKYSDKVIIRQGFFPQSADNLEDIFVFVSLDVDFEDSIFEGLCYFYPRLSGGGYIFVHDYNSSLCGVEKAVDKFEKKMGKYICKMPLCDANGTLVITK